MWPFTRKRKAALPALVFKSGKAFVDYHCKYMVTRLEPGMPLAALVLDAGKSFGTSTPVKLEKDGIQRAWLRVASDDGGFKVIAETQSKGDPLMPGDAVAWIPQEYISLLAKGADDPRFGWMGVIAAKIAPEIDVSKGEMTVICRY